MTGSVDREAFRVLPSTDRVLRTPEILSLLGDFDRAAIAALVRAVLDDARAAIGRGETPPSVDTLVARIVREVREEWRPHPMGVINATGVILHTNLGRAPLSRDAIEAMEAASGYCDVELDLRTGTRGSRQDHVRALLTVLTGAEAGHVVVNNAAAVTLALASVAKGKEVIVSRGQAVEIGGGFRIPVILRQSGARLVEVGTTNRTRLEDYAEAVSPRTAAILHVHSSNFRVVGFTAEPDLVELAGLAHERDLLLIDDNGSGALLETSRYGLRHEPTPLDSLGAGVDLVAFSGDKLLGGPQTGIILGRSQIVHRLTRHPMARAFRPDKLVLAALSATLLSYVRGDASTSIPIWRMIAQSAQELNARATHWRERARHFELDVELQPGHSTVGGGSLPGETLPTTLLQLPRYVTAAALRQSDPPVIAREQYRQVLLDLRTVTKEQEDLLLQCVLHARERR